MRTLYFDSVNGAAGDMINAALLDAGADEALYRAELAKLKLEGYELDVQKVRKQGFAARRFEVRLTGADHSHHPATNKTAKHGHGPTRHHAPHRRLQDILGTISASGPSAPVKKQAGAIFKRLAEAEARVHGTGVEEVHFHEVGAVDALVDVCGAAIALELLHVERVVCSPMPLGSGVVKCQHGLMPVPAPATLLLWQGKPSAASEETGELTTPTAAAILTTLAEDFGSLPAGQILSVGVGAGSRDGQSRPNILRAILMETAPGRADGNTLERDAVVVLEANLDDITGEEAGYALEKFLSAGALDAWITPVVMKKGRPALTLHVLSSPAEADRLEALFFELTPTFGVRRYDVERGKLQRDFVTVPTTFGPVRVKRGLQAGQVHIVKCEFEDCRRAAETAGVSLRTVREAARKSMEPQINTDEHG